ncbi:YheT family hydrolase [Cyclobacterium qasimii]|uniref:Hydrolase, alpha/beta fold family functionally coupled to Phosphoribulokinase n=2 Tax=Cyclobacterium qasimii TaxID=1350429 RepID=S7VD37_9BACT|nr:alpha/beta fold hydrolase [Cyclobacterium qasimii]EPR67487.1 Hydrolase, alpha/beta fold family functionally coupled to Phosphoribulokinase [Cyclobacterium qasimii M12-11B]GEO21767.1 alpha/beta hydrolase [Cyclobacterium qasimii]
MPVVKTSNYNRNQLLFNGHLQTIYPALFRKKVILPFKRERIKTPDDDFLDLDWLKRDSKSLVIISHGLEGNSQRPYMTGMAKVFFDSGYDVLNWNLRGCSESINKKPIFYHSGATYDLDSVISHAAKKYTSINLVGFSLGANITLKYLGEPFWKSKLKIKKAIAISVPMDLGGSCDKIDGLRNKLYAVNFLHSLKQKIRQKALVFPDKFPTKKLSHIRSIRAFDNEYTAPLHGFIDADDYYNRCSALHYLSKINHPTLILNAQNDPFLSNSCFPSMIDAYSENLFLEYPKHGGHVGFSPRSGQERFWSETRALEFIQRENIN